LRRPVIAGNWKMYKTQSETRAFFAAFLPSVAASNHCDIIVAPPFTAIAAAVESAKGSAVAIAAQNLHWEREGAFTGEISAPMIVESGCRAVIIGHSERRHYFGETDASVNRKLKAAIAAGLTPIVCVGETLAEREATPEIASDAHRHVRGLAAKMFTPELASALRILYGGSVKPDNIRGLMDQADIDGALVGGASLDPKSFAAIVNYQA